MPIFINKCFEFYFCFCRVLNVQVATNEALGNEKVCKYSRAYFSVQLCAVLHTLCSID